MQAVLLTRARSAHINHTHTYTYERITTALLPVADNVQLAYAN